MKIFARRSCETIFLLLVFNLSILFVAAQDPTEPIDCAGAERLKRTERASLFSFGVLNGKAIQLLKPEYPAAAKSIDVRGTVVVQVVIDPQGCVSEAKAVSGHPLLRAASVNAALGSSFEPIQLSGVAIWFTGVINYNYVSDKANWLEMGLFSDTPEKLIEFLPAEFERFRAGLKAAEPLPYLQREKAITATLDSISVELIRFPKDRWLFDLGRKLISISRNDHGKEAGLSGALKELSIFVEAAPPNVSPELILQLNKLTNVSDPVDLWKELREFKTRISHLGN